jgi:hypothetical protein
LQIMDAISSCYEEYKVLKKNRWAYWKKLWNIWLLVSVFYLQLIHHLVNVLKNMNC